MSQNFPIMDKAHSTLPWAFIAPHEQQARSNHGQTLKRLAERGGLDWGEAWAVLTGHRWGEIVLARYAYYESEVKRLLAEWEAKRPQGDPNG